MKTTTLLAYHGDAQLKTAMIEQIQWHADQDKIIKGSYGDACMNGDFKGCAIGCSLHSLAIIQKRKLNTADHRLFESELGIPAEIAYLVDVLFEALPEAKAKAFPMRVIAAIQPGADLSMVIPQFLLWLLADLTHGSINDAKHDATKTFVSAVIAIFDEWVKTRARPADYRPLARDARVARDAWVAWAARDAWVAWDAWDAWDAWAAWDARNKLAADKLVELLESAS